MTALGYVFLGLWAAQSMISGWYCAAWMDACRTLKRPDDVDAWLRLRR